MEQVRKRLLEIDLIRLIAIIAMPLNHVWFFTGYYGGSYDYQTTYGYIISYIPAAALFMFCMGMCFKFSRNQHPKYFIQRGAKLLLFGLLLNFFRETLPYYLLMRNAPSTQLFPSSGMCAMMEGFNLEDSLFSGDILIFAGMALMAFGLLKRYNVRPLIILALSVVLCVVGWMVIPGCQESWVVRYFPWFFYTERDFLFSSWFVFVALGYAFSHYLPVDSARRGKVYLGVGLLGIVSHLLYLVVVPVEQDTNFCLQTPPVMLFSLSTVFIFTASLYGLSRLIRSERVVSTLGYLSSLVNSFYVIHWIILGWTLAILYRFDVPIAQGNDVLAAYFGVLLLVVSMAVTLLYNRIKVYCKLRKANKLAA